MSSGVALRACSRSMEKNMTVEIANTEDGLGLIVRVCEDNICKDGLYLVFARKGLLQVCT